MKCLPHIILLMLINFVLQAQTFPIVWTNPILVTVNGDNSLTKTGLAGTWDATIASQNILAPGADGYLQFTYSGGTTNIYMVSLSRLNNVASYNISDYSIYVYNGTLGLYNANANLGTFGTLAANDVLKVSREANAINFYKNGVVIKTLALSANTDFLRADISVATGSVPVVVSSFKPMLTIKPQFQYPTLANNNGSIALQPEGQVNPVTYSWSTGETTSSITGKARTTGANYSVTATDAQSNTTTRSYGLGYPVAWSNITNVSVNADNSLTKTDAVGNTSGASSLNILPANTDGWVEFVINEPSSTYFIGLSRIDRTVDYTTIDYSWCAAYGGTLAVFEGGASRISAFSFSKGDVLRVGREGATIKYYYNGVLKRSVAVSATIPLIVDVSIYDTFGPTPVISASFDKQMRVLSSLTLPNSSNTAGAITLNIQGGYPPNTISWSSGENTTLITNKPRGKYTVTVTDAAAHTFSRSYQLGYPVSWTDLQNTTLTGNNTIVSKITGSSVWNCSAVSSNILQPSTDGWMEFVLPNPSSTVMLGLARPNSIAYYTVIDYAFYFTGGNVQIDEMGNPMGIVGSQVEGDVYTIAREGANIKYYINGTVVRTVATNVTYPLIVDSSLDNGSLPAVTTSFTRTPATYYTISNGVWTNPAVWSLADGGVASTFYPGSGDVAIVKGYAVSVTSGIYSAGVNVIATTGATGVTVDGASALLNVKGNVALSGSNNTNTANALTIQNGAGLAITP